MLRRKIGQAAHSMQRYQKERSEPVGGGCPIFFLELMGSAALLRKVGIGIQQVRTASVCTILSPRTLSFRTKYLTEFRTAEATVLARPASKPVRTHTTYKWI